MANDDALKLLGWRLHQDIGVGARTTAEIAGNAVADMSIADRAALRAYLTGALDRLTPSELKGRLNRISASVSFNSKAADEFLREVLRQLDASGRT